MRSLRRKNNKGQSMVEYALVIGVIVMGIIIVGKSFFGNPESGAGAVIGKAIESAGNTIEIDD